MIALRGQDLGFTIPQLEAFVEGWVSWGRDSRGIPQWRPEVKGGMLQEINKTKTLDLLQVWTSFSFLYFFHWSCWRGEKLSNHMQCCHLFTDIPSQEISADIYIPSSTWSQLYQHDFVTNKKLADTFTCPVLESLVPLFWISGGFCLICIEEANVIHIPWDPPRSTHWYTGIPVAPKEDMCPPKTFCLKKIYLWVKPQRFLSLGLVAISCEACTYAMFWDHICPAAQVIFCNDWKWSMKHSAINYLPCTTVEQQINRSMSHTRDF